MLELAPASLSASGSCGTLEDGPDVLPDDLDSEGAPEAFFRRDERRTRTERFVPKVALGLGWAVRVRGEWLIDWIILPFLRCGSASGRRFSAVDAERFVEGRIGEGGTTG